MDAFELMRTRRSTRRYKPEPVEETLVRQVVEAGRFAPSGGNNQRTHFLVIRDRAVLAELEGLVTREFAKMEPTPHMYPGMAGAIRMSKNGGHGTHFHQAPLLVITANDIDYTNNLADCAVAVENMMLMANALDLGSCWINGLKWLNGSDVINRFLRKLGLEENERVYAAMTLGYPDTEDGLPPRTPLERKGNRVTVV